MAGQQVIRPKDRAGVVVIGRNESAHLRECLESVADCRGRVVYADSASTDGSPDIARQCGAVVADIDPSSRLTPARGRNEGFAAFIERFPSCDYVQFVDGDSVVAPGWIEAGIAFLESHERAGVVCGHVVERHPSSSVFNWMCGDEWKGAIGRIDSCGGNAMIRVAAFREAGGFHADLIAGEEAELAARMRRRGWEIWRIDAPMVVHDADIQRFGDWWARARRGGYASANVWWLTRNSPEPLYGRQLRSALMWVAGLPPAAIVLALLLRRPEILLAIPAAWLLQTSRIAFSRGVKTPKKWTYAFMIMLAKIPEALGALRYASTRALRRS